MHLNHHCHHSTVQHETLWQHPPTVRMHSWPSSPQAATFALWWIPARLGKSSRGTSGSCCHKVTEISAGGSTVLFPGSNLWPALGKFNEFTFLSCVQIARNCKWLWNSLLIVRNPNRVVFVVWKSRLDLPRLRVHPPRTASRSESRVWFIPLTKRFRRTRRPQYKLQIWNLHHPVPASP